jgi:hypothetical protein
MGVKIEELGPGNPESLALLAWYQLVEEAEKVLPLLVVNGSVLKGKDEIESYLSRRERGI